MSIVRDDSDAGGRRAPLRSNAPRAFIGDPHLVVVSRPGSPLAERYRRLLLRLEQGGPQETAPRQLTVITSSIPGEGKTTTAVNLALAYAETRRHRTLLVDGDLRRPSMSRYLTPAPTLGLMEILAGGASLDDALIEIPAAMLWVLPAGAATRMPLPLLRSGRFGTLIAELRRRFDRIVIDAPPTVPFTDAAVLASHADGALLVIRAGTTTRPLIRRAQESLAGARVLGSVLNDVVFTAVDRYYYHYDDDQPDRYAYGRNAARA